MEMIIVLIGYMGSGKSIVGQELAAKLGYVFEDLDNYIEARESHSISEIFATKGELYFRKIETQYLSEMMS
ncbi:MAG: shikimate kinase, partial [Flavobacteriaceae bacterium]|nr:shikimate kinase [Flavobacteriaceae bacterium]